MSERVTMTSRARQSRPVGRGRKMRAAVLAATIAELAETGYAGLTIENVAQRAGVHKTTVYRHWADRERLIVEAIADHVTAEVPVPDTGSIEQDLQLLARALVRWLTSPIGQAVIAATVLSGGARVPEIAELLHGFYRNRFGQTGPVVSRAIARGELPAETDPIAVVKAMMAPIYLRLLITAEPIDEATADRAAAAALVVARSGLLRGTERGEAALG